jgi:hypothetical protein
LKLQHSNGRKKGRDEGGKKRSREGGMREGGKELDYLITKVTSYFNIYEIQFGCQVKKILLELPDQALKELI